MSTPVASEARSPFSTHSNELGALLVAGGLGPETRVCVAAV
jgi:hypothetical protein